MKTMKNRVILKWTAAGMLSMSLMLTQARAQTTLSGDHIVTGDLAVGTSGSTGNLTVTAGGIGPALKVIGNNGVVFTGSYGTGSIPIEGPGTRMMWYPGLGAFRAGGVTSTTVWDEGNIGGYSVAFGFDTFALGNYSIAFGNYTTAGTGCLAGGLASAAGGAYSMAFGDTAISDGAYSLAFGSLTWASGEASVALGVYTIAANYASTAIGYSTSASGQVSTAMGESTTAGAAFSTAAGYWTTANSYASFVIGAYNKVDGSASATSWVATDSLFQVGNGYEVAYPDPPVVSNAITTLKNGKTTLTQINFDSEAPLDGDFDDSNENERVALVVEGHADFKGKVRAPRQGDILMGEFGE